MCIGISANSQIAECPSAKVRLKFSRKGTPSNMGLGWTQGGSNADIVLADSYVKGLREGVDWATAYEAVVSDAEIEPPNWDIEGRGGLKSWKSVGYIPFD